MPNLQYLEVQFPDTISILNLDEIQQQADLWAQWTFEGLKDRLQNNRLLCLADYYHPEVIWHLAEITKINVAEENEVGYHYLKLSHIRKIHIQLSPHTLMQKWIDMRVDSCDKECQFLSPNPFTK